MKLSPAQDNVITSMIRNMAYRKTKDIYVVLYKNSVVRVKNKTDFAQINYLEKGKFKLRLKTPDELFDAVELRTLKVLVEKRVLILDTNLSKGNTYVYKWDYNNQKVFPMTDSIESYLSKQGVLLE